MKLPETLEQIKTLSPNQKKRKTAVNINQDLEDLMNFKKQRVNYELTFRTTSISKVGFYAKF